MEKCTLVHFLVIFLAGVVSVFSDESVWCCAPGQRVLYKETGVYHCWDSHSRSKHPLSLKCTDTLRHIDRTNQVNFVVTADKDLVIELENRENEYEKGSYCLGRNGRLAVLCYEDEVSTISQESYGYMMIASVVFLFCTAGVYSSREELRDVVGMSIVNFCVSLAIGLGILAYMKIMEYSDMSLCATRGFLAYFFLLASFFWMNAIAIQVLLAVKRGHESGTFVPYVLYAWGVPAILTVIMAIVNFMPGKHLKPGIGLNHCWFFDIKQQWIYMYSVMTALIVFNICIFIYASLHIWQNSADPIVKNHKFMITLQLFVCMGIPWTFEMISSLTKNNLFWEMMNVNNCLQGLAIFLVLVVFPGYSSKQENESQQYIDNITIEQPYKKMIEDEEKHRI